MGFSNKITGFINFIAVLASLGVIAVGVWLARKHTTECVKFLQWPVIVLGVFILLVSVAGFLGAACGSSVLLWIYLLVMFLLILLLLAFTVFAFVVTNKGAGQLLDDRGYKQYRLQDYSSWLQKEVNDTSNWRKIKSCIQDANVCGGFTDKYSSLDDFASSKLSAVQAGCCAPPSACGFQWQGNNTWSGTSASSNPDCFTWSNDVTTLCYDCNSCRAGVLYNVKHDWRIVAGVNVALLIILFVVYSFGCYAYRNVRREGYSGAYGKQRAYA